MVIETRSPEETFETGKKLGEKAVPGQVFTLMGDLGVGKTVFTQGLARGLDVTAISICSVQKYSVTQNIAKNSVARWRSSIRTMA